MGCDMLKIPIGEIVQKIKEKTGLSEEIITKKIDEKVSELSGLVSRDGAAHIVANEFGVQLFKSPESGNTKLKDILPGLKSVSFLARVLRIYPTKEFNTPKRSGKVASFMVGDDSGKMRVVFWDTNLIKMLEDGTIKENDVVRITNCYVKEGMNGVEVHAGNRTKVEVNPNTAEAKRIPQIAAPAERTAERMIIKDLKEGQFEVHGTIVYLFETGNPFFEVCPQCNKRVHEDSCVTHGKVTPKHSMVVSAIIDDGTGNIRTVFFGNRAEQLLGISSEDAFKQSQQNNDNFYAIKSKKKELIGKEIICEGNVANNSFSGDLEMICRKLIEPNPVNEAKELLKSI